MWVFFALGFFVSFRSALGTCTGKCGEPTLIYDSLKCTPVFSSSDDCCPSKYDCSNIEEKSNSNETKCYFEGKGYATGEVVDNDDIYGKCQVGCTCRSGGPENPKPDFNCATVECLDLMTSFYLRLQGCYSIHKLGECCRIGKECADTSKTCEVNGETIIVGTKFISPVDKCSDCVCEEGFKGKFEEPFCRKAKCIAEIRNQKEVYSFCAPSYISYDDCCPIAWICPEETDKIEKATTPSENKCKFGSSLLNIGDKFTRTKNGVMICECRIPPYMTCIRNPRYGCGPKWPEVEETKTQHFYYKDGSIGCV